ncbi:MAG: hypothetical protein ACREK2_10785 [Gemmatimonadota bacterium]
MMTGKWIRRRFGSRAVLALAGVFLAGLFAGLAIARWRAPAPDPGPVAAGLQGALAELDLMPEQRERIERILATSQARTDRVLEQVLPPIQAVVDSVDGEIRQVLTDEQRIRLEEIRRVIVRREVIQGDSIAP